MGPRTLLYRRIRALKSEKCNKTLISVQVYGFWYIFLFFLIKLATLGCPKSCVAKIATNYQVVNRLTDIFAVGKFDYGVMLRYQNLTRKPELFRASWSLPPWAQARIRCIPWNDSRRPWQWLMMRSMVCSSAPQSYATDSRKPHRYISTLHNLCQCVGNLKWPMPFLVNQIQQGEMTVERVTPNCQGWGPVLYY